MNEEINVHVIDYGPDRNLVARYTDPVTGKQKSRTTGTRSRKTAEKFAAKWEAELQEGRYKSPSKVTWDEFRDRYEDEVLPARADGTAEIVCGVFNTIERHLGVDRLAKLTAERVSYLQRKLRESGRSECTIQKHMSHLKAALNWAMRQKLINEVPAIDMPKRAKSSNLMKGRPITTEEFERVLGKVSSVLFPAKRKKHTLKRPSAEEMDVIVESWQHLLRGLWLSGLRLGEALNLWWNDRPDKISVDMSGRFTMLRIPAELEKGHKDRLHPVAPEFAEFLLATPEAERHGPIFNPAPILPGRSKRLGMQQVGRVISATGKAAGVKVAERSGVVKFASAHDLRRSFGERWAPRVMPQVLMELMRHESIDTTLKFYVGRNAEATAAALYAAVNGTNSGKLGEPAQGNSSGNTSRFATSTTPVPVDASP
jgi:integrase